MMAVTTKEEPIEYNKVSRCTRCDDMGSYDIYFTYNVLTLFFIPVWKWNKTYFAESTCCRRKYILDYNVGESLRNGEDIEISDRDLSEVF